MSLLAELKRRNVIRVGLAYLVLSWLLLQIGDVLFDALQLPEFAVTMLLAFLALGFIPALIFAWVYELTPEGIKRETEIDRSQSMTGDTGKRLNMMIVALLVGAIGLFVFDRFFPERQPATPPAEDVARPVAGVAEAPAARGPEATAPVPAGSGETERSIAVLPFANLSSDPENEYFADGLSEEILNVLAQLPDLKVAGRTSSFAFKGRNEDLREIGRTLGVASVLEGSVRRQGNQVRVTAQLIESEDGTHLWSRTYDRQLDDVFAIQDDIARNVADALKVVLDEAARERMTSAGVRNVEAFVAYQRAMALTREAHSGERLFELLDEADRHFADALEHSPDFSAAWFQRSDYYAHLMLDGAEDEREEGLAEYRRMIDKAFQHARNPVRKAFIDVDRVLFSDSWTGLAERLEHALTIEGCPQPTWIQISTMLGFAEAMHAMYKRHVDCDPLAFIGRLELGNTALWMGDLDTAIRYSEDSLQRFRDEPNAIAYHQYVLMALGRHEEAIALSDEIPVDNDFVGLSGHALPLAAAGRLEEARAVYETWRASRAAEVTDAELAVLAALGDRQAANDLAARMDAGPGGALHLLLSAYSCICGAPFDLEVTPNFRRKLEQAGIDWDPPVAVRFPAKDW